MLGSIPNGAGPMVKLVSFFQHSDPCLRYAYWFQANFRCHSRPM